MEFLIGLVLGLVVAFIIHAYHNQINNVLNAEAADLRAKILVLESKVKSVVNTKVDEVKSVVNTKVDEVKTEINTKVNEVKTEVNTDVNKIESDIKKL